MISVWSSPRNGLSHASSIQRAVAKCILTEGRDDDV